MFTMDFNAQLSEKGSERVRCWKMLEDGSLLGMSYNLYRLV